MKTTKSKDGTTLAYDVYGSGPALIYVTGAICFRKFGPIVKDAKVFANEFTVYVYDRRGRGDSGNTQPYTPAREVEDIEAIVDAAGGTAFVLGHSSGAVLAFEAAMQLPTKITKVTLLDAPYVHSEKEKGEYALLRAQISQMLANNENARALKKFLIGIGMPKIFAHLLPVMPGWKTMKALAPTLEYDLLLTSDLPPLNRASNIKMPTQVAYGEKSPAAIHEVAKQLGKAIPHAKLTMLAGQDHMANPKAVLSLITGFFKGVE